MSKTEAVDMISIEMFAEFPVFKCFCGGMFVENATKMCKYTIYL